MFEVQRVGRFGHRAYLRLDALDVFTTACLGRSEAVPPSKHISSSDSTLCR